MFQLEVHNMVILTTTVSDEDEDRILKYIEANKEKFEYESFEESIITAVRELGIDLYKDNVETESYTADIRWSEFEERSPAKVFYGMKQIIKEV